MGINIGTPCNNDCEFCFISQIANYFPSKKNKTFRPLASVKKDLRKMIKKTKYIVLTGGEPTIREDLTEIIEYANSIGFEKIKIESNGRRFSNPKYCDDICSLTDNLKFNITILGASSKIHDKITNRKGSFEETIKGIRNLIKGGREVKTNTPVINSNYKELADLTNFLIKLKIMEFSFCLTILLEKRFSFLIPHIKNVLPYLSKSSLICKQHRAKLLVGGFPFCLVSNLNFYYCHNNAEFVNRDFFFPSDKFHVNNQILFNQTKKECSDCLLHRICPVLWLPPESLAGCKLRPLRSQSHFKQFMETLYSRT